MLDTEHTLIMQLSKNQKHQPKDSPLSSFS